MERPPGADERRRKRQLAEIEHLLRRGELDRAGGLLVEHLARFPGDAAAAGRLVARHQPGGERQAGDESP